MIIHQTVAAQFADKLSIVRITTGAPYAAFAPDVAVILGFVISEDGSRWEGGITDVGIEDELARRYAGETPIAWARIDDADLPQDRTTRASWRLVSGRVVAA